MGKWYRINNEGKHKHPGGEGEINQVHSFMFLILGQNIYTLLYYTSILRYKAVCICVTVCMICVTDMLLSQNETDGHQVKRGTRTDGRGAPRCWSKS